MKIIGIAGSSGSGKTTVSRKISKLLNAEIIDADELVREISYKNSPYVIEIAKEFGLSVLQNDGELNRKALANIIYNDLNAKKRLDKITFNYVCKKIFEKIEILKKNKNIEYALIDAPLLLEAELDKICDFVIAVIARKDLKIARICKRDNITEELANKRLGIQQDDEYYISKSHFVIVNDDEKKTNEYIEEICLKIKM